GSHLKGFSEGENISSEDFFGLECDIVVPAALGNQITRANAHKIQGQVVVEGANGPVTSDAERILLERDITVLPDFLCNSGGVIGSYFEWLQNRKGEFYDLKEFLERTDRKFETSFKAVAETIEKYKTDWRTACYILAIRNIEASFKVRGLFP